MALLTFLHRPAIKSVNVAVTNRILRSVSVISTCGKAGINWHATKSTVQTLRDIVGRENVGIEEVAS